MVTVFQFRFSLPGQKNRRLSQGILALVELHVLHALPAGLLEDELERNDVVQHALPGFRIGSD